MRKFIVLVVALVATSMAFAQDFDAKFEDATLRLDYTFMGNATEQHIAIAELSEIARMSRTAYTVKFKRVTGTSPGKFQSHYRVELAKNLLSETLLPISQIAAEVGCFDTSHLVRIFSSECGVTPTEYRRQRLERGE